MERYRPCAWLAGLLIIDHTFCALLSFTFLVFPPLNYEQKPSPIYLWILTAQHIHGCLINTLKPKQTKNNNIQCIQLGYNKSGAFSNKTLLKQFFIFAPLLSCVPTFWCYRKNWSGSNSSFSSAFGLLHWVTGRFWYTSPNKFQK